MNADEAREFLRGLDLEDDDMRFDPVVTDGRVGNKAPDWGRNYNLSELWTEILPGLWVGGTADEDTVATARAINPRNDRQAPAEIGPGEFDAVVTLYAWARPVDWHVEELRTGIYDGVLQGEELDLVIEAAAWAAKRWRAGKKVLIRCQAGLNRAPFTTAVLLMVEEGLRAGQAIQLLRQKRSPDVLLNADFVRALIELDHRLRLGLEDQ